MDRQNPFDEIERMFDQFSRQFGQMDTQGFGRDVAVDVADLGESFEVTADIPGYDSDEIDVTLPDTRTVRIVANQESTTEQREGDDERRYLRQERRHRSFSRTVSLPDDVAADEADATYDNGVLTIELPKQTASQGTNIPVS
ncbi:MAG: Hsp20/alpha crystallin family protein [Haloarculaceae archaeon]